MDLSFQRRGGMKAAGFRPVDGVRIPTWPFLRTASAASQAASPTAQAVAGLLWGQEGGEDWIQELADILAPGAVTIIETAHLAGSFNPLVARQLKVEKMK